MRLTRAALLLGLAALPLAATATPRKAPARTAAPRAASGKPIAYTMRTLPNGLRVYAIRDTKTANIAVQVWYDVGSKDAPKGKTGFAHMFEHLMFKATRNLKSENFDRLTEDVGGYNNASTNDDYTNYYEVVPANHLQRLLFAEADRMASLVVEPVSYASERDVVKEELRLRTLATPYGKLYSIYYPEISYRVHPYARPGIGSLENLEAATIDDVRAFHATYYRPDIAVMVVAGNFDPAQLNAWVDKYFAGIKRPDRPIPRVTVAEPERTEAINYTVYEPNTPLPAVLISYPIPADNDADIPALTVLDAILSRGDSSRFYQDLVYRDQLAQSANTFIDTKQGAGNFVALAIMAGGKNVADGEAALRAEIARLRTTPVTTADLTRAKNQLLTATIESRETADGKASTIARSVIFDGDPAAADKQLAAIQRVTPADIQRVARRYLTDNRSAAIHYIPAEMAPKDAKSDKIEVAKTVAVADLKTPADVEIVTPASDADRVAIPDPGKPVVAALPAPVTMKLANGMSLIVVEEHDLPIVTVALTANGGAAADPSGRAGVNTLMSDLLLKGTPTRSATRIATEVENLGGSISSNAGWDAGVVSLEVKSDQLAPAMAVLADVVRNPTFTPAELERDRAQTIDGVQVELKNPARLAGLIAARAVMGDGPYGHPASGTPTSLKAITRADVQAAYAQTWTPRDTTMIMVGDITPAAARVIAEKNFGSWREAGPPPLVPPMAPSAATAPRIIVVDMPNAGQAGVVVARPGIARSDPDFYAASAANATLGVGFSSRLNQEIRIKRGLAYGAGSSIAARRTPGYVAANTQTKNPSAPEVVGLIIDTMRGINAAPNPTSELASLKAVLIGDFGRDTETTGGIASILASYTVENVPLSELKAFAPGGGGVDPAAVQRVAERLLDPTNASIVVVGDAKLFLDDLRKKYPNVEVIPASAGNLDNVTLK